MEAGARQPKEYEGSISALNAAIEALNLAEEVATIALAKAVFGSVGVLLGMIRVSSLPFFVDKLRTGSMRLGRGDQPNGLRRTWAGSH